MNPQKEFTLDLDFKKSLQSIYIWKRKSRYFFGVNETRWNIQSNNNHILSFFPGKESEPNFIGIRFVCYKTWSTYIKQLSMGTEDMSFSKLKFKRELIDSCGAFFPHTIWRRSGWNPGKPLAGLKKIHPRSLRWDPYSTFNSTWIFFHMCPKFFSEKCLNTVKNAMHFWCFLVHFWCTFGALLMHFWCTFGALLMHFWCTFDALLMHFWCTFDALLVHFWCTFDALLMHFWNALSKVMHFWCTFDALFTAFWCTFDALFKSASKVRQKCAKSASKVRQKCVKNLWHFSWKKNGKVLSQKEIACIEFEGKTIQCSLK